MRTLLALAIFPAAAFAQAPQPSVAAPWDITQTIAALSAQAQRVKPILDQLTPQEWVQKGAPETYVTQLASARQELDYVTNSAKALERQPDRLTLALDTYLRWEAFESRANLVVEAVRRYQNPAVGDLLVGVLADNAANRDKLRDYVTDLASQKEQEFAVVDKEAQRCRDTVNRPPPARRTPR